MHAPGIEPNTKDLGDALVVRVREALECDGARRTLEGGLRRGC